MSKMSLINELSLLENIDIKNEKKNPDFFHNSNNLESKKLFNKLNFHLISRNILKNKFVTKLLFKNKNIIIFTKAKAKSTTNF